MVLDGVLPGVERSYAQTFQDTIIRMHRSFVGGITKLVYHVYPYRDSPTSKWPGYHNFGQTGFSNAWGPREPYWVDAPAYNDYFARNQQVLTQGDAKTDVAVYMQNYLYPPSQGTKIRHWGDTQLQEAGYTRDYLNPTMLDLPNATVTGNRLAADGPAYKALIIDSEQQPATDPVKTSMPVAVARKILGYARAGLPVIVVGAPPDRTPGNTPDDDVVLKAVIGDLLAQRTVSRVDHQSDVPEKLRSLGIRPAAEPATPSSVLSIRRRDDATRTDYYFFYNQGIVSPPDEPMTLFEPATGEPVDRVFSLEGSGRPYVMDAWSGRITPIVDYTSGGGRVAVRIRLSRDNGALIALSDNPNRFGTGGPAVHVTSTTADECRGASGRRGDSRLQSRNLHHHAQQRTDGEQRDRRRAGTHRSHQSDVACHSRRLAAGEPICGHPRGGRLANPQGPHRSRRERFAARGRRFRSWRTLRALPRTRHVSTCRHNGTPATVRPWNWVRCSTRLP